jgi:cysteine synthase A
LPKYFEDNTRAVGRTPLVRLNKIIGNTGAIVLGKVEGRNPAFSIKDRIAVSMIEDAIQRGALRKGMEIVEPTSGNTGISLAYVCALKGYSLTLIMPNSMSVERRHVMKHLEASLVLTDGTRGAIACVRQAKKIVASDPGRYFMPQQFENPANWRAHERTTGPEIWDDTEGQIDALICGVGTGGTITGVSRFIKGQKGKMIHCVAVEPAESPVITQTLKGEVPRPGPHGIQGIGAGFIPRNLDLEMVDEVMMVTSDEAIEYARLMARREGILCGISSGAAVCAAVRLAQREEFQRKIIVAVLPSAAERYLSSELFQDADR